MVEDLETIILCLCVNVGILCAVDILLVRQLIRHNKEIAVLKHSILDIENFLCTYFKRVLDAPQPNKE